MPRPRQKRWWHRLTALPWRSHSQKTKTQPARAGFPGRTAIGIVLMILGCVLLSFGLAGVLSNAHALILPSFANIVTTLLGAAAIVLGLFLFRTAEARLWMLFIAFMGAALIATLMPGNWLQAAGALFGWDVAVQLGGGGGGAVWGLLAGGALTLIAVFIYRRA